MNWDLQNLEKNYLKKYKENSIEGLYIRQEEILPLIKNLSTEIFKIENIGKSFEERDIYKVSFGTGSKKVLIWSQMHGNESTGTKALFDFYNFISNPGNLVELRDQLLENCTFETIPMLNPDGAEVYTRVNAQNIDLNRDAVNLKGSESKILRTVLDNFNPKFCFNLHDQRTIFNVEGTENPATISFLAPSIDESRKLTEGRKETMSVIVSMNEFLQKIIPNHVGRYTDEFYPTATGDNFQKLGHNTILIEAGHFPEDYSREKTREFNFYSLVIGCMDIAISEIFNNFEKYFTIPNNDDKFLDVIYENAKLNTEDEIIHKEIGVLFTYNVKKSKLIKNQKIIELSNNHQKMAHKRINLQGKIIF
ncbi:M14 metallopeptidase family protein [Aureivirga sp. CE67]|uniref:M14 family metallopeptidase n=1 Tax=Aureivirga sp. CE67 TaxID=1788983 RepID=UPI0018C9AF71|nr:M14 metallopeptidase family protein [Aureivirga sp. CE67]